MLIDSVDDDGVIGRTFREAPEIDGVVRVESDQRVEPGTFVVATIVGPRGVDLLAKASNQSDAAAETSFKRFGQSAIATPANA